MKKDFLYIKRKTLAVIILSGIIVCTLLYEFAKYKNLEFNNSNSYAAHQAYSFLNGRLDTPTFSKDWHDVSYYRGKIFAYWPPLSALMVLPIVAYTGYIDFPQVIVSIFLASINAIIAGLIAANIISIYTPYRYFWIFLSTMVFGLGTSNSIFGCVNNAWYFMQLTASTFLLLSLYGSMLYWKSRKLWHLIFTSWMFSIACIGRANMFFSVLFLIPLLTNIFKPNYWFEKPSSKMLKQLIYCITPLLFAATVLGVYNYLRFDSPFEFGIRYQNKPFETPYFYRMAQIKNLLFTDMAWQNIYVQILRPYPQLITDSYSIEDGFGLFYQVPFLLLGLTGLLSNENLTLRRCMALGIIPSVVFILTFAGTGRVQFGARYLHDVVPFIYILTLLNCFTGKRTKTRMTLLIILGLLSIGINIWGVIVV